MKRNSLLFALLVALFMPWAANAQETVTIGDNGSTNTQYYVPFNMYYNYSLTQQIYPACEIGTAGTIHSIAFDYTSSNSFIMENVQVYMLLTDKDNFESTTDMVPLTNATKVYEGTFEANAAGWVTITLDTPFVLDGANNLLVCCYDPTNGYYSNSTTFRCTSTTTDYPNKYLALAYYSDSYTPSMEDLSTYSGSKSRYQYRNNIQLNITPDPSVTLCCPTDAITVPTEGITAHEAVVNWEGGSAPYNVEYKKTTETEWTVGATGVTGLTTTLTGLTQNTTYQARVQSACGSAWKTSANFTTLVSVQAPTDLTCTGTTTTSATLSWTENGTATSWVVAYKTAAEENFTEVTVNSNPCTITGLTHSTNYTAKVCAVGDGENSSWSNTINFSTTFAIPLVETFNSTPAAWTKYSGLLSGVMDGTVTLGTSTYGWQFGTSNDVFDNHTRVNIYGTSIKYWLVTPTLTMENNVQLSFDVAYTAYNGSGVAPAQNGTDDKFVVLITTDGGTTWSILRQWDNAGSEYVLNNLNPTPATVTYDLSSYAGQSIAVAFYAESTESNADNNLHIDNVSIDYIPACAKPTELVASDVTAHEATITWTSDAAAWQVQLNDEDPIDVEEATYTFENLDPETAYTAKVRTNCDGIYSEWTNALSFTTSIACPAPTALAVTPNGLTATFTWQSDASEWEVAYATDAEADPAENIVGTVNEATYTVNELELGDYYFWVRANCGEVDGYSTWAGPVSVHIGYCVPTHSTVDGNGISNVTFGMGDNIVNNDTPKATYADYHTMIGAVQAGVESTIAITYATGYTYGTIIWVDLDNSLSFEDSEIVYTGTSGSANPTTLNAAITIPATQTPGDYMMRIGGADSGFDSYISGSTTTAPSACYTGSWACFQDYTLRVLEAPSCMMPTGLAINYTGGTEATISWTSDAEAWNMRVNGVDVNGVITNPYTLTGLELATTYSVEVQANCGEDGTSEWSNAVSFTTDLCLPEDMCAISYSFTDQYNDSWNGAYMNIVDATTGELLYELTMPDVDGPYEGSFNVCDGRDINFVWVRGNYPNECGYTFTHNGNTILEKATNTTAPSVGVVLNYTVDCGFASYTLNIKGYEDDEIADGYVLIASPVTVDLNNHEMTTGDFDLYYFDQEQDKEWINYEGADGHFNLEPGKGYLYAKKATAENLTYSFNLTGTPYSGNGEVTLSKTTGAQWEGWNLVGNPFGQMAYIVDGRGFYTMNAGGSEIEPATSSSIEAMEGVFVEATTDGETMTFTTEEPNNEKSMLALNLSNGRNVIDRAIVRFGEGSQLPKFQLNPNHTKVYIPQDNKNYAIVNATEMGEMPVSFKAENNGSYTLSFNAEEVSFNYLHLIDNMTGADVDLLATPSYSFEANTTDYANRFRLVFATGNNINDDNFAFFSNGSFVINNEGMATVQVIDINGRILSSESINGCANVSVNAAAGVYMIRLVNGENVKVQKVVVR